MPRKIQPKAKTGKEAYAYSFPATRGVQAGKEYFTCTVPVDVAVKIFLFNESDELPVELRRQRTISDRRVNDLKDYIIENPKTYVLPALTASINGDVEFEPIAEEGLLSDIGMLKCPIAAQFLLADGQHRKAGLAKALKDNPELADEHISVVFFHDLGLKRAQQIFADINRNAKTPDANINLAFDHRDPIAELTRKVIQGVPFLTQFTQSEGSSISKTSGKLLLRKWVYEANKKLCEVQPSDREAFCTAFWNACYLNLPEWRQIQARELSAYTVRTEYLSGCAILVSALAVVASKQGQKSAEELIDYFASLANINWHRSNPEWCGVAIEEGTGKILTKNQSVLVDRINKVLNDG